MSKILEFKLKIHESLEEYLDKNYPKVTGHRVLTQSLDARGAPRGKEPHYLYRVEVLENGEEFKSDDFFFDENKKLKSKPLIIGAGPAGLFSALRLAEYGIPAIIFERGDSAHKRMKSISKFWRYGEFDSDNNVCYGEGGAGLFSDGKLITRIKSPYIKYVMRRLVDFGAPKEIEYMSNPHLGSNKIRNLISKMTEFLKERGVEIHYNTRVDELLFEKDKVVGLKTNDGKTFHSEYIILATGHSAGEMYEHLKENEVSMKHKDFAVGVRIEHPRKQIDAIQYGKFADDNTLGAARYRLSFEDKTSEKGTYSFCMCPGGYVLSSGTDSDGIVVNGMSNYSRSSPWSNSALVVSTEAGNDFEKSEILSGLYFQRQIEKRAFDLSKKLSHGKEVPAQRVSDFVEGKESSTLPKNSCPSGIFSHNLNELFPDFISKHLQKALEQFNRKMPGFLSNDAVLMAPETRTSSPVTITRDKKTLVSVSHKGLYPCGEGAGYAGGITSAAVDGIRVVESIIQEVPE